MINIRKCIERIRKDSDDNVKAYVLLDNHYQVAVRIYDKDTLAFFAPNDQKYYYTVMHFVPINVPGIYTAMMRDFKWRGIFCLSCMFQTWNSSKVN